MLSIANVGFPTTVPPGVVLEEPDPPYHRFRTPTATATELVQVHLTLEMPEPPPGELLFDSGAAWRLHRTLEGAYHFLQSHPQGPLWRASCPAGFERVQLFVNPSIGRKTASGWTLHHPVHYPLDQLLLMYRLAGEGLIIHGTGARIQERLVILAGVSGAGKTTIARAFEQKGLARVLSDDRMVVRQTASGWEAWGTPWPGEGGHARPEHGPLAALYFLHRHDLGEVRPLSPQAALQQLLPVVSLPWFDRGALPACLSACEQLVQQVPCWELAWNAERGVPGQLLGG